MTRIYIYLLLDSFLIYFHFSLHFNIVTENEHYNIRKKKYKIVIEKRVYHVNVSKLSSSILRANSIFYLTF
jgi:hypothetical protein